MLRSTYSHWKRFLLPSSKMNSSFRFSGVYSHVRSFLTEKKKLLSSPHWPRWSKLLKSSFKNNLTLIKKTWTTNHGSSIKSWSTASSTRVKSRATPVSSDLYSLNAHTLARLTWISSSLSVSTFFAILSPLLFSQVTSRALKIWFYRLYSKKNLSIQTSIPPSSRPFMIVSISLRLFPSQSSLEGQLLKTCSWRIMLQSFKLMPSFLCTRLRVAFIESSILRR